MLVLANKVVAIGITRDAVCISTHIISQAVQTTIVDGRCADAWLVLDDAVAVEVRTVVLKRLVQSCTIRSSRSLEGLNTDPTAFRVAIGPLLLCQAGLE